MQNIPKVKLGIIAVSRDCFVISLSQSRRKAIVEAFGPGLYEAKTTVENELDAKKAVEEVVAAGCNALCVFLGNFGPETPETQIAQYFEGPVMYAAAAEDGADKLVGDRGDAYCGMLNCSYNLGLRKIKAVIPSYPVGTAADIVRMLKDFIPVARAIIGLSSLKVISFGPRPQDFFACNAPIKPLYDLGIEIQENSELDLLVAYRSHANDKRIPAVVKDMEQELGKGEHYPDLLPKLAQYELTLLDWIEANRGSRSYVVFANKCWPAFPKEFGFEPCYVNSRLASKGIPVACETDIYGAVSEYIGTCITDAPVTLLDINNTVPEDMYSDQIQGKYPYVLHDTFMGFHCGNTPSCRLTCGTLNYQLIQNRLLEDGGTPDFTRGTLEGDIAAGPITFFRLHGNPDSSLQAYVAQGEVLPVPTRSFGGIGVFAISEMGRFYRHVLISKHYPHHGAVTFGHVGKALYALFDYLGIPDISFNQPKGMLYKDENPFD
ncbi:MAG: L-fucose/L-arabinose isomerase family protein [Spirochaetia bacterium]|jgi:L-fucose isomerase-like protein|nr:L-fucose/L-arabinose isomerase family protein [Spirochaetia bacterium]